MLSVPWWADRGGGSLQALLGFLGSLNNLDTDGRIITDKAAGTFKFLLLNAAAQFSKVLTNQSCTPTNNNRGADLRSR